MRKNISHVTKLPFSALCFRILLLIIISTTTACSPPAWKFPPQSSTDEISIYVISHGWHTGIAIPNQNSNNNVLLNKLDKHFKTKGFYEIGWGDAGFYQADEITSNLTLRAIFWPTKAIMHVVSLNDNPDIIFKESEIIELKISHESFANLTEFIMSSFSKNSQNDIVEIGKGIYGESLFFKGKGKYYLTNTCNSWTTNALYHAGAPIRTFLTLTADSAINQTNKARFHSSYPFKH